MRDPQEIEEAVRQANRRFYEAFEELNIEKMEEVWGKDDFVKCVHPGWDLLVGWDAIRQSWVDIFQGADYMKFALDRVQVDVFGNIAMVFQIENLLSSNRGRVSESLILATNLYELRGSEWVLIVHHASPILRTGEG